MSPTTIVALTFGATFAIAVLSYYLIIVAPEQAEQKALRKRMKSSIATNLTTSPSSLVQQEKRLSNVAALNAVLEGAGGATGPLKRLIDQAGMDWTVGKLLILCGCSSIAAFIVLRFTTGLLLVSIALGIAAAFLPILFVQQKARKRVMKFEEQFPEAIDLLSRALRAGHAFTTGLSMVAAEMQDPVGTEFRLAYDRQNFGMPLPQALRGLADRVPLIDAKFFVTAVLTQREAGGNLSEVLDNLSAVIRERFKVKRQVRVVTSHARLTGWVLACLPPCMAVALFFINPDHMKVLWADPMGVRLVVVAIMLQVIGSLVIRKLVNIEY